MFSLRNKKNIMLIPPLICSYVLYGVLTLLEVVLIENSYCLFILLIVSPVVLKFLFVCQYDVHIFLDYNSNEFIFKMCCQRESC